MACSKRQTARTHLKDVEKATEDFHNGKFSSDVPLHSTSLSQPMHAYLLGWLRVTDGGGFWSLGWSIEALGGNISIGLGALHGALKHWEGT
jgi:hypothetical protein